MDTDYTLTFLLETYRPRDVTLKLYVATAWMGDLTIEDVCQSAELAAELPKSLIRKFLKSDDVDEVSLESLQMLADFAEEE